VRRAVLDSNVFVSVLISPSGAPALLLAQAHGGGFELIASPRLLGELHQVLLRKKFRRYATEAEVGDFLAFIRRLAAVVPDPGDLAPVACPDPGDDYLLALAYAQKAVVVTGDSHLLEIGTGVPICAPADFLASEVSPSVRPPRQGRSLGRSLLKPDP
jgi:putative PIN family toxin of toxin-antitoxin system